MLNIGTVLHGTHRPQDMLSAFADTYKQYAGEETGFDRSLFVGSKALAYWMEHNNPSSMEFDVASDLIDELMNKLDEIAAPHNCHFSTTEGDGSDFGFWPNDGGEA